MTVINTLIKEHEKNKQDIVDINGQLADKAGKTFSIFTPTLLNGWINYGQGYDAIKYWKDSFGIVHIQGAISSGTDKIMFNLPEGYRPRAILIATVASVNGSSGWDDYQVSIKGTGDVEVGTGIVGKTHIFTVSFLAGN